MRPTWASVLALTLTGCAFVVMHVPDEPPAGGRTCSSGPAVVDAIAVVPALLIANVVSALQHSDKPYPGTAASVAPYVPAVVFAASAVYGVNRHGRCLALQQVEARDDDDDDAPPRSPASSGAIATGSGSRSRAGGR